MLRTSLDKDSLMYRRYEIKEALESGKIYAEVLADIKAECAQALNFIEARYNQKINILNTMINERNAND